MSIWLGSRVGLPTHSVYPLGVQSPLLYFLDTDANNLGHVALAEPLRGGIVDQAHAENQVSTLADDKVLVVLRLRRRQCEQTRDVGRQESHVPFRADPIDKVPRVPADAGLGR